MIKSPDISHVEYSRTDVFGTLFSVQTYELLLDSGFLVKNLRNIKVGAGHHSSAMEVPFNLLIYYFVSHAFVNV